MTLKNRIDADGLPNFSMGGLETGVSAAHMDELQLAIAAFDSASRQVSTSVAAAEQTRFALLSWGRLIERVADIVVPLIGQIAAREQTPADATNVTATWQQRIFSGLAGVWSAPADQRGTMLQGMIGELLAAAAGQKK
jgi:hypothetical protein